MLVNLRKEKEKSGDYRLRKRVVRGRGQTGDEKAYCTASDDADDTWANQSTVFFFHKLSSWPSSHQDLVPLLLSLTDFPVQLFKVYKQEPSIQLAADPVK